MQLETLLFLLHMKVISYQVNSLAMYTLQDKGTTIVFLCTNHHSHRVQSLCIAVTEMRSFFKLNMSCFLEVFRACCCLTEPKMLINMQALCKAVEVKVIYK